jgi:hypothetical protein
MAVRAPVRAFVVAGVAFSAISGLVAQQQAPASQETVRPIAAPTVSLPPEAESAGVTKFSFIAYGDTRGQVDGQESQPDHTRVVDGILEAIQSGRAAGSPIRFVIQSGDAVTRGGIAAQWNLKFVSLIERLTREGGVPYFFAAGNHDIGATPADSSERDKLRNAFAAMSNLWPPEGSPRRLDGYATFAFGFGQFFFITLDSNIATDRTQLAWVTRQLDTLDRRRYPHVVANFHHPPISSGPHAWNDAAESPAVEAPSAAMRSLYLPLFRRHHVRMTITGHDHLFDHWMEHYEDQTGTHRMDHVVSGGGGAPTYVYKGEPDLKRFEASAAPQRVRVEHLAKPGPDIADNPHHFLIIEVDGDRLWVQAIGTGPTPFLPYGRPRIELSDR